MAMWIDAGADVKLVANRAGHASVAFTLNRYGHLYPDADPLLADLSGLHDRAHDCPNGVALAARRAE